MAKSRLTRSRRSDAKLPRSHGSRQRRLQWTADCHRKHRKRKRPAGPRPWGIHRAASKNLPQVTKEAFQDLLQEARESEEAITSEDLPQVTQEAFEDLLQEARESEEAITSEDLPQVTQEAFEDLLQEARESEEAIPSEDLPQVTQEAFEDLLQEARQPQQDQPLSEDDRHEYEEEEFDDDFDSESEVSRTQELKDSDGTASVTADSFATPSAGTDPAQESSESLPVSARDSGSSRS
eukprot:symbB.v1.2.023036.t1/scaffold2069.1/size90699/3